MSDLLLQVQDLSVHFKTPHGILQAVRGVSFDVRRGEMLAIVGETGCGKSVTGRAILRILPGTGYVAGGTINFAGTDLLSLPESVMRTLRGKRIAMIFQDAGAALNPLYTIGKQIMFVMAFHNIGRSKEDRHQRALQHLHAAGMPDPQAAFNRYPHELSGGMQQRAMIALALSAEPDLIIADEPTTALDVTIQAQILDLLTQLQRDRGISIILITHDLGIVAQTCQQVLVLYAGRVAETGSVQQVFRHPAHPYTRGLLAALPGTAPAGSELQIIPGIVQSGLAPLPGCAFAPRCTHAIERCQTKQPPLTALTDDHGVACVLHDGEQPSS